MGPVVSDLLADLESGDRSREFLRWIEPADTISTLNALFKEAYSASFEKFARNVLIMGEGTIEPRKGVLITNIVNE